MKLFKATLLLAYITLVLCDDVRSQSTFFLDKGAELGLISEYPFLHGFGAHYYSNFEPDSSFKNACEKALVELNSNLFLSVYIEEFKTGSEIDFSFPEISIRDSILQFDEHVVKLDSFLIADQAYCVVSFSDFETKSLQLELPSFQELKRRPVKQGNIWFALGAVKNSRFNQTNSWIKAKNEAIMDLSRVIKTSIQSSTITTKDRSAELTYIKSSVIFEDLIVIRRFISEDHLIVMIAVPEEQIFVYR
ncbi:MAG: hypothetical protein WD022_01585 [Balneolaceae bacterium]